MALANVLAANAVSRQFSDLSATTVDATVEAMIDSLACAIAGLHAPGIPEARGAFRRWGTIASTTANPAWAPIR